MRRIALDKSCQKNLLVFRVVFTPLSYRVASLAGGSWRTATVHITTLISLPAWPLITSFSRWFDMGAEVHINRYVRINIKAGILQNKDRYVRSAELGMAKYSHTVTTTGQVLQKSANPICLRRDARCRGYCHQDTRCLTSVKCDDFSSYISSSPRQPHRCHHLRLGPKQPISTRLTYLLVMPIRNLAFPDAVIGVSTASSHFYALQRLI